MKVTPADGAAGGGFTSRLSGLGGLAAFAGIDLPDSSAAPPFRLYIESLHTRDVADRLSERTDLMSVIFSSEWDAEKKSWKQPASSLAPLRNLAKALLGVPSYPWRAPDGARLKDYLTATIKVSEDPKTPVVTIYLDHKDPGFAVELLSALHQTADQRLREKALRRSNDYIQYLSEKLNVVAVAEHRMAIAEALSEQEKMSMMTSSALPYTAELFAAPTASVRPTRPRPLAILAISFFAGMSLGVLVAVALNARRPTTSDA